MADDDQADEQGGAQGGDRSGGVVEKYVGVTVSDLHRCLGESSMLS